MGNRLSKHVLSEVEGTSGATTTYYQYDTANQLTQTCADSACTTVTGTFTYDLNGNLISRTDGATAYGYDAENRLTSVSAGSLNEFYAYDHQGRRVSKHVLSQVEGTSNGTTTNYLYNGSDILAEYSTWASLAARYTHGPNVDDPLLRTTATGTQFYHADGLGSVVALSNPDGSSAATARYDAWGNTITTTGTVPQYGYTGREPDATGLIYYRARYYDPTLGRFLQRDPIGLAGGINLYTYVHNNPPNLVDPDGTLAFFWHFSITLAAGLKSGLGFLESVALAWNSMGPDFREGSLETTSTTTNVHAMLGIPPGEIRFQTPDAGRQAIEVEINQSLQSGNVADAAHTAVDLATPRHFSHRWEGLWSWEGFKHILADVFPSWSTVRKALENALVAVQAASTGQAVQITPTGRLVSLGPGASNGIPSISPDGSGDAASNAPPLDNPSSPPVVVAPGCPGNQTLHGVSPR